MTPSGVVTSAFTPAAAPVGDATSMCTAAAAPFASFTLQEGEQSVLLTHNWACVVLRNVCRPSAVAVYRPVRRAAHGPLPTGLSAQFIDSVETGPVVPGRIGPVVPPAGDPLKPALLQ